MLPSLISNVEHVLFRLVFDWYRFFLLQKHCTYQQQQCRRKHFFFLGGEAEVYCHREGPKGAILKIQASRWCKKRSYGLGKKEDRKIFIHAVPASTAVNNIQDAARWMEDNPRGLQISETRRKRYAPFEAVYTCHRMVTWVNEILYPRLR